MKGGPVSSCLRTFSYMETKREKPKVSWSLTLFASASQISLEVDAESMGRLTERPSISDTDTTIGFLVLVACRRAEEKDHVIKLEKATCDYFFLRPFNISVPAAPARQEVLLALRSFPSAAAFWYSRKRSLPERNG